MQISSIILFHFFIDISKFFVNFAKLQNTFEKTMNSSELMLEVFQSFGFKPTNEQKKAVGVFADFMFLPVSNSLMLMCGSAGTGKTSLATAMVRTLHRLGQRVVLLAPTGRAAKVFSVNSGLPAFTIHRKIYRQRAFSGLDTAFNINDNLYSNTLFIVDEASMIANDSYLSEHAFGTGRLLDDLIHYVYSGKNCHLMLIGDKAQLPPVGSNCSPALEPYVLESYGLKVMQCNMSEVLRQSQDSGILFNAAIIRQMITHDEITELPKIHFAAFPDIHVVDGREISECLASSYSEVGSDETMVIVRSNKRANVYNMGIRNTILGCEEELSSGDRIMIVKNNYYWTEKEIKEMARAGSQNETDSSLPSFLANGDIAVVEKISNYQEVHGFRFIDAWLRFPDYDDYELFITVMLDSLSSESPSLNYEQQQQLFNNVLEDYSDMPLKADRMKAVRADAFYNALQIKYAYAVTCHKAQGGQWEHVYLDQGYITGEMLNQDYIHWLYTAFTRATRHLYLVNWPKEQMADGQKEEYY